MGNPRALFSRGTLFGKADLTTFVTVGNATQPFDRLLKAVASMSVHLPSPIVVQRGISRISHEKWQVRDYMEMGEFEVMVQEADLLIMHGGAGSIIHAVSSGKRPVVMPRRAKYGELVDDHQLEFVLQLQRKGYVVLAREAEDLPRAVMQALAKREIRFGGGEPPLVLEVTKLLEVWAAGEERRQ